MILSSIEVSISGRLPEVAIPNKTPEVRKYFSSSTAPESGRRSGMSCANTSPWRRCSESASSWLRARPFKRLRTCEKTAAHPHAAMDAPAVNRHARLPERALPGEYVRVNRVDQGAVKIKDKCSQVGRLMKLECRRMGETVILPPCRGRSQSVLERFLLLRQPEQVRVGHYAGTAVDRSWGCWLRRDELGSYEVGPVRRRASQWR